jgi:hypothetical protein
VSEDGEDGYELREVENDGRGGWEEGGVDGSAWGGVSATAVMMEWLLLGRRQLRVGQIGFRRGEGRGGGLQAQGGRE